jgi:hypothetical protein
MLAKVSGWICCVPKLLCWLANCLCCLTKLDDSHGYAVYADRLCWLVSLAILAILPDYAVHAGCL